MTTANVATTSNSEMKHTGRAQLELTARDVQARAVSGVLTVALRGVALRLMGLLCNVILARLLLPGDLGKFAFAGSVMVFVGFLGDGGLGAALIRRKEPPERLELGTLLSLQALVLSVAAALTAAAAWPLGDAGRVTAIMAFTLPITAFRMPGAILLERDLRYSRLVTVELVESSTYYVFAVTTVLLGWGVWGLVTAAWVRSIAGSLLMTALCPAGLVPPTASMQVLRRLLGFGFRYQAVGLVNVVRDQGLNFGTAAIAGLSVLGVWTIAYKLLQVPFLLFDSLWRVSFPAMSRLHAAGEDLVPIIERGVGLASVATGGILALLVSGSPALVPAVLGSHWAPAVTVIPWAAIGLMIAGPVSVATAGYLYAIGDAATVLRGVTLHTAAWILVAFVLLPRVGIMALGMGWLAASLVEASILGGKTVRSCGARVFSRLVAPTFVACCASAVGWLASALMGYSTVSGCLAVSGAAGLYMAGMFFADKEVLFDAAGLGLRSLRRLGSNPY